MNHKRIAEQLSIVVVAMLIASTAHAQTTPRMKMSTELPPGIASPDKVETRLGSLSFFDGFPDDASVEKLYENLDFQRAVQAYLLAIPAVSQATNRNEILKLGPANTTVPIFENRMDSKSVFLTPNTQTPYTWMWLDLRSGPLVLEAPPKVLGAINDMWYRWVVDIGFTGPDKGEGGKFLILPPGYNGDIPSGYFVVKSPTLSLWAPWRSFVVDGDPKPGVDLVKKHTRVYRLADAANPPAMKFVNVSGKDFCTVAPGDYQFWELLNQVVQEEPSESLDPIRLGFYASVGIEKGRPFAPDARMKKILTEAAAVGDATARAIAFRMRQRSAFYYENSSWQLPFIGGYQFQTQPECSILMLTSTTISLPLALHLPWKRRWSVKAHSTHGQPKMRIAIRSMEAKTTSFICRPRSPSTTSGQSSFMTTRHAPWCRPTSSSLA